MRAKVFQHLLTSSSTCQKTKDKYPLSIGVKCSQNDNLAVVANFLDNNYRYKSVVTQICHNAKRVSISNTNQTQTEDSFPAKDGINKG